MLHTRVNQVDGIGQHQSGMWTRNQIACVDPCFAQIMLIENFSKSHMSHLHFCRMQQSKFRILPNETAIVTLLFKSGSINRVLLTIQRHHGVVNISGGVRSGFEDLFPTGCLEFLQHGWQQRGVFGTCGHEWCHSQSITIWDRFAEHCIQHFHVELPKIRPHLKRCFLDLFCMSVNGHG